MSAVEVTIAGVLFDRLNRTAQNVVLIGEATLSGLAPGGGPIIPPGGGGGEPPPVKPPGFWGGGPHPMPPMVPPGWEQPPTEPPTEPTAPTWKWVWNPNTNWIPAYVPEGGKPHPVPPPPAQPK